MNNPDAPGALARDSRNARWRARAILLGVFAVFFVPVLAALWLILMTVAALPGLWTVWQLGGIGALRRLTRNED